MNRVCKGGTQGATLSTDHPLQVIALPHSPPWLPNQIGWSAISRRWTIAVAHSGHQETRIGQSPIWSFTISRKFRRDTGYAFATP